jgi:hypothetical protein
LISRHYAFFGYIISDQIRRHPFGLVIKVFNRDAENCTELLDNLVARWFAAPGLDVVQIGKRDQNAVILFELCRQIFRVSLSALRRPAMYSPKLTICSCQTLY